MRMVENWCSDEEKPLVFHVWFPKATTTLKQKVPSVQMALKNWQSNQNKLYWFGGYHPSTKHFGVLSDSNPDIQCLRFGLNKPNLNNLPTLKTSSLSHNMVTELVAN